jgi:hypothetical protein
VLGGNDGNPLEVIDLARAKVLVVDPVGGRGLASDSVAAWHRDVDPAGMDIAQLIERGSEACTTGDFNDTNQRELDAELKIIVPLFTEPCYSLQWDVQTKRGQCWAECGAAEL